MRRLAGSDDPRQPGLGSDPDAEYLADHIRQVVELAPPLTPEQRDRLALLLNSGARQAS